MNKLLKMSVLLALSCAFNNPTYLPKNNCIPLNQETNYNYCVEGTSIHNISFSFGDETIINHNVYYCTIIDDFTEIPSITYTGNIGLEIISSELNNHYVRLTLPEEDGQIDIRFTLGEACTKGLIYSSKGENNQYAISSTSLYCAWRLVGNIPGQEYMDNDEINAEDKGPTPDNIDSSKVQQRATSGIRVYGYLKWTDDAGNIHPLVGVKVKITFIGNLKNTITYTNSSGYFDINYTTIMTTEAFGCDIHIYSENDMVKVISKDDNVYEKAQRLFDLPINNVHDFGTYTFSENQDSDLGNAMQIFTAVKNYSDYARTLNGGVNIEKCIVSYPSVATNAQYLNGANKIELPMENEAFLGDISVHGAWDVIGHEYGHHLQKHFFMREYYGNHYVNSNDIYGYFKNKEKEVTNNNMVYTIDNNEITNAKIHGLGLSWKEAWPTFFAISAQDLFNSDLKKIPTVGDKVYNSYNGINQSLLVLSNPNNLYSGKVDGETDETIIMSFLYRLWDSENNVSCDNISISDADLWTIMIANNPEHFYGFIDALYNSGLDFSRSDLGMLLEGFKISASNLSISVSNNYAERPTFYWTNNGTDIIYNDTTYNYSNNKFSLCFYDISQKLILKRDNIYSNYYTLNQKEWDSILLASGSKYYVVIQSYATLGIESGPYYSQYYEFNKPDSGNITIELNNDRYYERTLVIPQGAYWTIDLSFDHSGDKMIQTFGIADTRIWLYEADGTTLIEEDDDDGYGNNAFINKYLESGKKYILKVRLYSSNVSAKTRLSIISNSGLKNNEDSSLTTYENIYNIHSWQNFSFGSYLIKYNSKVITWTPSESGNYKIALTSEFDNYLYVVDPRSAELNVYNVHENDDYDDEVDLNAGLIGYYEKDITYFVVYSQYDPSSDFVNFDSGDDITIKFNKL